MRMTNPYGAEWLWALVVLVAAMLFYRCIMAVITWMQWKKERRHG